MSWFAAVILGLVQGLTEYLPVSSSAHVLIVGMLAGWGDPSAAFTAVTQIGTLAAVLIYFRGELKHLLSGLLRTMRDRSLDDPEGRLAWLIGIGSLPILGIGFAVKDVVEGSARNLVLVAVALILGAGALALADRRGTGHLSVHDFTLTSALVLGCGQALALIPGVSRSGATIAVGLFLGFNRVAATRYSFLLAIPAVTASGLYELKALADGHVDWAPTLLATLVAFAVGYAVIHWLLKFVATHSFAWFVRYRLALGILLLILVATGAVSS